MLLGVALFGATLFALVGSSFHGHIFNVSSPTATSEVGATIAVFVICFCVGLPLNVVYQVRMAFRKDLFTTFGQGLQSAGTWWRRDRRVSQGRIAC